MVIAGCAELSIRIWGSVNGVVSSDPLPLFIAASPFAFWLSWSLGAYLCECFLANRSSRLFRIRFDLMCAVTFALPLFKPTAGFTFLAFSMLTGIAIERLMTEKWRLPNNRYFNWGWSHLSLLGVVSYSFYLFHQPIVGLTGEVFGALFPNTIIHPLIKYAACMAWYPIILLISYILYRLVEKPSIQLGSLLWMRIRKPDKAVQATATSAVPDL